MKITLLQQDIIGENPLENIQKAERAIQSQPGSDLYVFPEMFTTGIVSNQEGVAEPAEGPTLQWMKRQSREADAAIAASLAVEDGGLYFNRLYFVQPDGCVQHYDKRHLFSMGHENEYFEPGKERQIVEFRGMRWLLQICYDLRFPVFSRNRKDYDAVLYVANWPTGRMEVWRTLLRARAIENQCYVVGVNRVGQDSSCTYSGASAIVSPYGKALFECMPGLEQTGTCVIDKELLDAFREKFPVWQDADEFTLK